ncbi:unnamed protein product, partial [Rotaria sp. Silwood1]
MRSYMIILDNDIRFDTSVQESVIDLTIGFLTL